jgi:type I restriction enzyme, S subunit
VNSRWLQNLPEKWETIRLKNVVTLRTDRTPGNAKDEGYIGLENIESWTGKLLPSQSTVTTSEDEDEKQNIVSIFRSGDLLFGKLRPYLAKAHLAKHSGICSTELLVVQPSRYVDEQFLLRALLTREFIDQVNAETFGVKMPRADWDTVSNVTIPLPPLATQRAIAAYLDRETAKIDAMIDAKQRLLALLAEKRRALITHAVTRGLDPAAPMRDSGVPWIGEVPAHWEVTNLKYVAQIGNGSTPRRDYMPYWQDGNFPWLTSTVVNQDIIEESTDFVTGFALRECHLPIVEPNSVLVAITGEGKTRGKAAVLPYRATINQHMAYISPQTHLLHHEFLQRYLAGSYKILRMISEGTGSTKGALTCEQVGDFPISLPPISEQLTIVIQLKTTVQHLDTLDTINQHAIELINERRAALIAAAVTGNIHITE